MVRLPEDLARLRLQTESGLRAAQPAAPIADALADLQPGHRFSAQLIQVLPDGRYQAVVEGKPLTLALAEPAQPGDTLELMVLRRTPEGIVAQRAGDSPVAAAHAPTASATLSRAAQAIGALLATDEPSAPAALNRGAPLLAQPPLAAAPLAQALAVAVRQSGLFYESHQAQWVEGRLPVAELLLEPQGRHSAAALLARHAVDGVTGAAADSEARAALPIADDLRPLVRQQLDAVATQRLVWHGEAWPGQAIEWDVERGEQRESREGDEREAQWTTRVRLSTPRLGAVDAQLQLGAGGVRLSLVAAHAASAADLRNAAPALERSLAAAGLALRGFQVRQADERG